MAHQTVTIILERHTQSATADFLAKNLTYFQNSIIGMESTSLDGRFRAFSSQEEIVECYQTGIVNQNNSMRTSLPLLLTHNPAHIYQMDTYGISAGLDYFLTQSAEKLNKIDDYYLHTWYFRDIHMAQNTMRLIKEYSEKNIILIVGAGHFAILYHLLYLLGITSTVQINVIDLVNLPLEFKDKKCIPFYFEELPVNILRGASLNMHSLIELSQIPPTKIDAQLYKNFCAAFLKHNSSYTTLQEKRLELFILIDQFLQKGELNEASREILRIIIQPKFIEFISFPLPEIPIPLVGSQLFPPFRIKHTELSPYEDRDRISRKSQSTAEFFKMKEEYRSAGK